MRRATCLASPPPPTRLGATLADETRPDVIVMDLLLNGTDGIAATRSLRDRHPGIRVLVLTGQTPTAALVHAAADAGAPRPAPEGRSLEVVVDTIPAAHRPRFTFDRQTLVGAVRPPVAGVQPADPARPRPADRAASRTSSASWSAAIDLQTGSMRLGITLNTARGVREEPVPQARGPQPAGASGRGAGEGASRTRRVSRSQ